MRYVPSLVLLAALAAGCAPIEPSPRGKSPYRPVLIVNAVTPAMAVVQGEGGPVEVTLTVGGYMPVQAISVEPESPIDDGAPFESVEKGISPMLEPGEFAKATAITRPPDVGEGVVRRFTVLYADSSGKGKDAIRRRPVEVRLTVAPAATAIEDARSRAKVHSKAYGVFSSTLLGWAFERGDGLVYVPEAEDPAQPAPEPRFWRGVSLRAFAWIDLFVGHVPVRPQNEQVLERLETSGYMVNRANDPSGEPVLAEGAVVPFFDWASENGFVIDGINDGSRRVLTVIRPEPQP